MNLGERQRVVSWRDDGGGEMSDIANVFPSVNPCCCYKQLETIWMAWAQSTEPKEIFCAQNTKILQETQGAFTLALYYRKIAPGVVFRSGLPNYKWYHLAEEVREFIHSDGGWSLSQKLWQGTPRAWHLPPGNEAGLKILDRVHHRHLTSQKHSPLLSPRILVLQS